MAFFVGYYQRTFDITIKIWAVGFVLSMVLSVLPWPFFKLHPVKHRESCPPRVDEDASEEVQLKGERALAQLNGGQLSKSGSGGHTKGKKA